MKTALSGLFIMLCLMMGLGGCSPKQEPVAPNFNNIPKIPGGIIGIDPGVYPILDFASDVSVPGQIRLSWKVSPVYLTQDYSVIIFKKNCNNDSSICSAPNVETTSLSPIFNQKGFSLQDEDVQAGVAVTYWAFIKVGDQYSDYVKLRAIPAAGISSLNTITASNFWPNYGLKIGLAHDTNPTPLPSLNLLGAKPLSGLEMAGKMAIGHSGAVLYYADTTNNRIITMINQQALACTEAEFEDPLELQFCVMQYSNDPFVPWNVLGQPNKVSTLSCQDHQLKCQASSLNVKSVVIDGVQKWQVVNSADNTVISTHNTEVAARESSCDQVGFCSFEGTSSVKQCNVRKNECLTKPTHLAIDGNRLLISDSGNNRVLIYDSLPVRDGCETGLGSDIYVERNCTASKVIGKKSTLDLNEYTLNQDGDKILSQPGALLVKDGNLFIADRGNNRVVRAREYLNDNVFSCSTAPQNTPGGLTFGAWNPLCVFDHVLGQRTLKEKVRFEDIVLQKALEDIDVISSDNPANTLLPEYEHLLKRYFGSPSHLAFAEGKLLVSTYEDFVLTSAKINALRQADPRYENFYTRRADSQPIALKSRILIFTEDQAAPVTPECSRSVFDFGGCDAQSVIGQLDFKTIPVFSGDTADNNDYRNSVNYGLTYVTDFVVDGKILMAIDGFTNDIYFWTDWTTNEQGHPFSFRIENPKGAPKPNSFLAMPNLSSISGILFNPTNGSFLISDPGSGFIYPVRKPQ